MKHLFDFDPEHTTVSLKYALSFEPKVWDNTIETRIYNGLLLVLSGKLMYSFEGGEFCAGAGTLIYLPAGSIPYRYKICPDESDVQPRISQIEFSLYDQILQKNISYSKNPVILFDALLETVNYFNLVISGFEKKKIFSSITLHADFLYLLAKCKTYAEQKPKSSRIAPALLYIHENYTKQINVSKLADMCFLSESQLRRLFINITGETPIAYKNRLLMNSAKKLLNTGVFSIGEIAELLGFYDIYAFSHFFSVKAGISPKKYKDRFLSKEI